MRQTSYKIRVAASEAYLAKGELLWESGKQSSDASIHVEYGGPALESRKIYFWQVRVADNYGHLSDWSRAGRWETGLLEPSNWKAKWITPNLAEDETKSNPAGRTDLLGSRQADDAVMVEVGSGTYVFESALSGTN